MLSWGHILVIFAIGISATNFMSVQAEDTCWRSFPNQANTIFLENLSEKQIQNKLELLYDTYIQTCDPDSTDPSALNDQGVALGYLEKFEEAITYYDKALLYFPEMNQALANKGTTLVVLQKYEDAIPYLEKALTYNPNEYIILSSLVDALFFTEKYEDSLIYTDKILSSDPNNIDTLYRKAVILSSLDRFEESLTYFDKIMPFYPNDESVKQGRDFVIQQIEENKKSEPQTCEVIDVQKFISRKYNTVEDYPILYELDLRGLSERNDYTNEILVEYKGNFLYDNECQSFFKEYKQLGNDVQMWRNSCTDLGEYPNAYLAGEMYRAIDGLCRFADLASVKQTVDESKSSQVTEIVCGKGTIMNENGQCVPDPNYQKSSTSEIRSGCLIATATFGSELSPQVQQLRELRDNILLETNSGSVFMTGFNQFYYSFSPTIADLERQNPVFKEAVKLAITPLITSLSLLNYVEIDTDVEVLGYGISLILLNVGMYFVTPIVLGVILVRKKQCSI